MSDNQGEFFEVTEGKHARAMSRGDPTRFVGDTYGVPFQRHSDTSKEAAAKLEGSETLRALVYQAIASSGDDGMTDPELQAELGLSGSTQRPRRVRLVELGLVRDSGNSRASKAGRQCTVWVVE
tara:strand:- start:1877 stop:2248 length:372 start_codon:yes stop_codon:yes gene_type:complete